MNYLISRHLPSHATHLEQTQENLQQFLSIIRSRLNVIGTSIYLLENSIDSTAPPQRKYILQVKQALEAIRELINE